MAASITQSLTLEQPPAVWWEELPATQRGSTLRPSGPWARFSRARWDTFDGRLVKRGLALDVTDGTAFRLEEASGELAAGAFSDAASHRPATALPPDLRRELASTLENRALIAVTELSLTGAPFEIVDDEGKVVVRGEAVSDAAGRVEVVGRPLRGYQREAKRAFSAHFGSKGEKGEPGCPHLTRAWGASPGIEGRFDNRLDRVPIRAEMAAAEVGRRLLGHALDGAEANVPGTLDDIDVEFLHDLRVSVRRARTFLAAHRTLYADAEPLEQELRWLGQITGRPRDLDVLLETMPHYLEVLEAGEHTALDPLVSYLLAERSRAYTSLAKQLRGRRFRRALKVWRKFCNGEVAVGGPDAHAHAAVIIDKAYRRVKRDGRRVAADTPATELHELRKRAKRLRYLIEGYRSLYPAGQLRPWVTTLKRLQNCLGELQDLDVHGEALRASALEAELTGEGYLAAGHLLAGLAGRRAAARARLDELLPGFVSGVMQRRLNSLLTSRLGKRLSA